MKFNHEQIGVPFSCFKDLETLLHQLETKVEREMSYPATQINPDLFRLGKVTKNCEMAILCLKEMCSLME